MTILLALVAGVVFYQLYRVLGQRTGNERPPFDPVADQERQESDKPDNVIALPNRDVASIADFSDIDKIYAPGSVINNGLRDIYKADSSFSIKSFMDGVRTAYEMVLIAFANGDRDTLKMLLAPDVYDGFSSVINDRKKNLETIKFSFVGLNRGDIASAHLESGKAHIALHFVSDIISVTYDKDGKLVEGDSETIVEIKDLWTFSRNLRSNSPNWVLTATEEDQ